ncbi:MAG: metallophosphoesterase, partial [Myxococcota bacterium]|nr:metallophosphoesterase [Myxococcota bacterium]
LSACEAGLSRLDDDDAGDNDDAGDDDTSDDDDAGDDDTSDDDDAGDDDTSDDDDAGDDDTSDDDDATPQPKVVRFVALGDTGEGNTDQYAVAGVIETVCANQGCDFAVLLGDNFYDIGVDSVTDPQWDQKFEQPYANVPLVFYPSLGNHDGGAEGTGLELWKGDIQVDYSAVSSKWEMPARWYKHSHGPVDLYALDTSSVFFDGGFLCSDCDDNTADMAAWLTGEWSGASTGTWRIAYGHHPYRSNGPHGNAGLYEGIPLIPYLSGQEIKDFMDSYVCGSVDLYICGHDHSRQWLMDNCGGTTNLMVSGAGAKTSSLGGSNPTYFEDVGSEGFTWFEINGNTMTVQWWDKHGTMNHQGTITK